MNSSPQAQTEKHGPYWTEPSFVDVDGLRTAYRRKGSGDIVLYLHGAGMTQTWLPIYDELAKSFDTLVPEHPGFGDTPMPETLQGIDDFVLHYDALLRNLKIDGRVHLVGHSLGGLVAANLAIFYPQRYASVTLLHPAGLRVPEAPTSDPFRWGMPEALDAILSGAGEKYLGYFDTGDPVEGAVKAYEESITFARLLWNPRYDIRLDHRLARVSSPTTVVGFEDDRFIPLAHAVRWAALIPGSKFELLKGANGEPAAHLSHIQQPAKLAEIIAQSAKRAIDQQTVL